MWATCFSKTVPILLSTRCIWSQYKTEFDIQCWQHFNPPKCSFYYLCRWLRSKFCTHFYKLFDCIYLFLTFKAFGKDLKYLNACKCPFFCVWCTLEVQPCPKHKDTRRGLQILFRMVPDPGRDPGSGVLVYAALKLYHPSLWLAPESSNWSFIIRPKRWSEIETALNPDDKISHRRRWLLLSAIASFLQKIFEQTLKTYRRFVWDLIFAKPT